MECVLPSLCGMSISRLLDEPNPLCCRRTPVMHSLAALIQAIPSRVANPTVFLPFHRHAWLLQSTFFFLLSKQSHKHLLCPDCVGKSWGRRLAALTSWCPWARPAAGMQGVFCLARGFEVVQGSRFALKCDTKRKKTFTIQQFKKYRLHCIFSFIDPDAAWLIGLSTKEHGTPRRSFAYAAEEQV